jgi:hypothetical protein
MPKAISSEWRALIRAGTRDGCVDFHAPGVASATLHVAMQKVIVYRVENNLRNLRAGAIIEEDEAGLLV